MEVFNIYGIRSIIRSKSQQNAEQLCPLKEGSPFHPLDDVSLLVLTFSTHDSDFFRCKTCQIGTRLIVIDSTGAVIASRSIQNETSNTVTCLAIYLVFMYMNETGSAGDKIFCTDSTMMSTAVKVPAIVTVAGQVC